MPRPSPKKKNLAKPDPASAAEIDAPAESFEMRMCKVLLILLTGLFVYSPAFHGGWLWDDDQEITANAVLADPAGLVQIWSGETGADYLPLKTSVQWMYFQVVKTNPTAWHLLNVVLHLANALLVWRLLSRLKVPQAWLGGLLFVAHPILVPSVAWVSELKNTLSLLFLLAAMLAWIRFDAKGRPGDYALAVVLFLAALLCKASVIMFPVVVILYAWWRSGLPDRESADFRFPALKSLVEVLPKWVPSGVWRAVIASIPLFLISLGIGILTMKFQYDRAIGAEQIPVGDLTSRFATAGISIFFYLWQSFVPVWLLPIYPRWKVDPPPVLMFLAWPLLVAILIGLWTKRASWGRHVLFGLGFFLINLFPIIGLLKMSYMRITWASDHFMYLPVLGLLGLVTAGAGIWYDRSGSDNRNLLLVCGVGVFAILTGLAHRYSGVYSGEYEMWTYTLKSNPDAWQAHSRLGKVLLERGDNDGAFEHIEASVRLRPDLAETHNNYGAMLEKKGDVDGAIRELKAAVERAPDIPIYKINLASLLVRTGRHAEGLEVYQRLLEISPDNPTFLCNLGVSQYFLGRNDEAISSFRRALEIQPDLKDAKENLAQALKKKQEGGASVPPQVVPQPLPPGLMGTGSDIRLFGN